MKKAETYHTSEAWRAEYNELQGTVAWINGIFRDLSFALSEAYYAYRHRRMVRDYYFSKDTRWANCVYLKRGGDFYGIKSVEGYTWTLETGEQVDTREIAKMTTARFEMGYD